MLDAVLDGIISALSAGGTAAVRGYPADSLDRKAGVVVCVGIKSNTLTSPGAGDYIGEKTVSGTVREVYGCRMETVVSLDVYSPDDGERGASGCLAASEAVSSALAALPSGIKAKALIVGETAFDAKTEMFRCPMELHCVAFLTREADEETGEFTDFVLRGVLA